MSLKSKHTSKGFWHFAITPDKNKIIKGYGECQTMHTDDMISMVFSTSQKEGL